MSDEENVQPAPRPLLFPDPVIEAYLKDVDRTLIREQLKLSHTERLQSLINLQAYSIELRKAGEELKRRQP